MERKLKIGFFTESYYPLLNGVTTSVSAFAESLRKRGHTVYIFAPMVDDYVPDDKYVITLPSLKSLPSFPQFRLPSLVPDENYRKISKIDLDIIHAHGYGAFALLGYQAARRKKIPFVMTFHTMLTAYAHYFFSGRVLTPAIMKMILRFFATLSDGILAPSPKMKQSLTDCGVTKEIALLPNFVSLKKPSPSEKNLNLHELYSIPKTDTILLSVGRMEKEKNFLFLLKTMKQVAKKNSSIHLVLVGSGTEEDTLKQYVRDNKLMGTVHFTGSIDAKNLPALYTSADIFVFSSVSEVHPMVLLEAATYKLPFIVSEDSAYTGIVEEGKNGFRLPLIQKQFAQAILELSKDKKQMKDFGRVSYEIVAKRYTEKTIVPSLETYYLRLIDSYVPGKEIQKNFESDTFFEKIKASLKNLDGLLSGK